MFKYTGRFAAPMVIGALVFAAACGGGDKNADTMLAADTSLNRDLALAGQDTAAQPSLTDVPATASKSTGTKSTGTKSTGTKSTPTTKTSSGNTKTSGTGTSSRVGTIAAGTRLSLTSNSRVCTNTNKVGDSFNATLTQDVVGENGAVIPAGSTVNLQVTRLKRSENVNDPIVMEFRVRSVKVGEKRYALDAHVESAKIDRVRNEPKSADVKKVLGGAAIGAIAGQVLGKNTKSTVIGAAAGAAAGAGAAAATANYEGCVPSGGAIVVTLEGPVQITT